jgi:hypothetical protein
VVGLALEIGLARVTHDHDHVARELGQRELLLERFDGTAHRSEGEHAGDRRIVVPAPGARMSASSWLVLGALDTPPFHRSW